MEGERRLAKGQTRMSQVPSVTIGGKWREGKGKRATDKKRDKELTVTKV